MGTRVVNLFLFLFLAFIVFVSGQEFPVYNKNGSVSGLNEETGFKPLYQDDPRFVTITSSPAPPSVKIRKKKIKKKVPYSQPDVFYNQYYRGQQGNAGQQDTPNQGQQGQQGQHDQGQQGQGPPPVGQYQSPEGSVNYQSAPILYNETRHYYQHQHLQPQQQPQQQQFNNPLKKLAGLFSRNRNNPRPQGQVPFGQQQGAIMGPGPQGFGQGPMGQQQFGQAPVGQPQGSGPGTGNPQQTSSHYNGQVVGNQMSGSASIPIYQGFGNNFQQAPQNNRPYRPHYNNNNQGPYGHWPTHPGLIGQQQQQQQGPVQQPGAFGSQGPVPANNGQGQYPGQAPYFGQPQQGPGQNPQQSGPPSQFGPHGGNPSQQGGLQGHNPQQQQQQQQNPQGHQYQQGGVPPQGHPIGLQGPQGHPIGQGPQGHPVGLQGPQGHPIGPQGPSMLSKIRQTYVSTFHNLFHKKSPPRGAPAGQVPQGAQQPFFQQYPVQGQGVSGNGTESRRKKIKLRRKDTGVSALVGRPRNSEDLESEPLQEAQEEAGVRRKRSSTGSGYRMPGLFYDKGDAFYLEKDPSTGDVSFLSAPPENVTKPSVIIASSYSKFNTQGQSTYKRPSLTNLNSKLKNKRPTFYKFNKSSTIPPPRLPSFYFSTTSASASSVETTTEKLPESTLKNLFPNFITSVSSGESSSSTSTKVEVSVSSSSSKEVRNSKKPVFMKKNKFSAEEVPTVATTQVTTTPTTTTTTASTTPSTTTTTTTTTTMRPTETTTKQQVTFDPYLPKELMQFKTSKPVTTTTEATTTTAETTTTPSTTIETTTVAKSSTTTPPLITSTLVLPTEPIIETVNGSSPINSSSEEEEDYYYDSNNQQQQQYYPYNPNGVPPGMGGMMSPPLMPQNGPPPQPQYNNNYYNGNWNGYQPPQGVGPMFGNHQGLLPQNYPQGGMNQQAFVPIKGVEMGQQPLQTQQGVGQPPISQQPGLSSHQNQYQSVGQQPISPYQGAGQQTVNNQAGILQQSTHTQIMTEPPTQVQQQPNQPIPNVQEIEDPVYEGPITEIAHPNELIIEEKFPSVPNPTETRVVEQEQSESIPDSIAVETSFVPTTTTTKTTTIRSNSKESNSPSLDMMPPPPPPANNNPFNAPPSHGGSGPPFRGPLFGYYGNSKPPPPPPNRYNNRNHFNPPPSYYPFRPPPPVKDILRTTPTPQLISYTSKDNSQEIVDNDSVISSVQLEVNQFQFDPVSSSLGTAAPTIKSTTPPTTPTTTVTTTTKPTTVQTTTTRPTTTTVTTTTPTTTTTTAPTTVRTTEPPPPQPLEISSASPNPDYIYEYVDEEEPIVSSTTTATPPPTTTTTTTVAPTTTTTTTTTPPPIQLLESNELLTDNQFTNQLLNHNININSYFNPQFDQPIQNSAPVATSTTTTTTTPTPEYEYEYEEVIEPVETTPKEAKNEQVLIPLPDQIGNIIKSTMENETEPPAIVEHEQPKQNSKEQQLQIMMPPPPPPNLNQYPAQNPNAQFNNYNNQYQPRPQAPQPSKNPLGFLQNLFKPNSKPPPPRTHQPHPLSSNHLQQQQQQGSNTFVQRLPPPNQNNFMNYNNRQPININPYQRQSNNHNNNVLPPVVTNTGETAVDSSNVDALFGARNGTAADPKDTESSEEEVIYVTQDELNKMKETGQLDKDFQVEPEKFSDEEEYYDEDEDNSTVVVTSPKPVLASSTPVVTTTKAVVVTQPPVPKPIQSNFNRANYVPPISQPTMGVLPQQQQQQSNFQNNNKNNIEYNFQPIQENEELVHYQISPTSTVLSPHRSSSSSSNNPSNNNNKYYRTDYDDSIELITASPTPAKPTDFRTVVVKSSFNTRNNQWKGM